MSGVRDKSFDAIKGLVIIFVVAIHASNTGWDAGGDYAELNLYATLFIGQFYLCAVPVFFFVSGYFVGDLTAERNNWVAFVLPRAQRLLLPYFVWSLFFSFKSGVRDPIDMLWILATGGAVGPYYFVVVLFCFVVLAPFLHRQLEHKMLIPALVAGTSVWLCFVYYLRITRPNGLDWQIVALPFWTWLIFYVFGMKASAIERDGGVVWRGGLLLAVFFVVAALVLSWFEAFTLLYTFGLKSGAGAAVKFSSYIYSAAVIVLFLEWRKNRSEWPRFFVFLGGWSFGIYLIHEAVRAFVTRQVEKIPGLYDVQPFFQLTVVFGVLVLSVAMIWVARSVLPGKVASKYLGF